jgi:tetratricopeptide (TPR) repeat protein
MAGESGGRDFLKVAEPILRKVVENIETPYVWMPLGLFLLCILALPVTQVTAFAYLAMAFGVLAFTADWVGRWRNRRTPPKPLPQTPSYRDDIFTYLAGVQAKAVEMLLEGKDDAARALTDKNLQAVDTALKSFPNDAEFHALMGYTLKDIYQSSKGLLSPEQRKAYLDRARMSFEHALQLDPNSPSAHNGIGNVLFFEGKFDDALNEHDRALQLTSGNYPAADHDKWLVMAVKAGQVPFDL